MSVWDGTGLTPGQIAGFDQSDAAVNDYLNASVDKYIEVREALGEDPPLAMGAIAIIELMKEDVTWAGIISYAYSAALKKLADMKEGRDGVV